MTTSSKAIINFRLATISQSNVSLGPDREKLGGSGAMAHCGTIAFH